MKEQDSKPHYLNINFTKPTVSEYLSSLTSVRNLPSQTTQEFSTIVWNGYAAMSDEDRVYLLKGLIERSSEAQKKFLRTELVKGAQYSNDVVLKQHMLRKVKAEKSKVVPVKAVLTQVDITANLYVKLLNFRYDHTILNEHLLKAGPESSKIFIQLLSRRCQKVESILDSFNAVILGGNDDEAYKIIQDRAIELLNGKSVTIYSYDSQMRQFNVKLSNWRKKESLKFDLLFGAVDLIDKHLPYSIQSIKSMILDFSTELINAYTTIDLDCMMSQPITNLEGRIIGVIEVVDKLSGSPAFDAEDEFVLKRLAGMAAIILTGNEIKTESRKRGDDIQSILKIASLMSSSMDIPDLIQAIMQKAQTILHAERVTLFLVDKERQQLWSSLARGCGEIRIPLNRGIAGFVATSAITLNIPDAYADSRFNRQVDLQTGFRTRNILCMPMQDSSGEVLGVLQIINKLPESSSFTPADELMLQAFSALAGATIEKSALSKRLQVIIDETSQSKSDVDMILSSIADTVLTLDIKGRLMTINHPEILGSDAHLIEYRSSSYTEWLRENEELVANISKVIKDGEVIQAFDYEMEVGGEVKSVNYSVHQLTTYKKVKAELMADLKAKKELPSKEIIIKGVLIVIEVISTSKRILSTLGRYMAASTAQQVIKENSTIVSGQRTELSVLLADLRQFNHILNDSLPQVVVKMLNDHFTSIVDSIIAEGGILDKYMGDKALAVFGLPFKKADDALRSVKSALRMKSGLQGLNVYHRKMGRPEFAMGIGSPICISTKQAISGTIGSPKKLEYSFIGENVAIATAIEHATKEFGVFLLIDETTKSRVEFHFHIREIDIIKVNKLKPLAVYEVYDSKETPMPYGMPESWRFYAKGLEDYRFHEWKKANEWFSKAVQVYNDLPSKRMIERIREIVQSERVVSSSWDYTWPIDG